MSAPVSPHVPNRNFLVPAGIVAHFSFVALSVYMTSRAVFTWCDEAVASDVDGLFSYYFKGLIQSGMTCAMASDRAKLIAGLGVALFPLAAFGAYKTASWIKPNIRQIRDVP